MWRMRVLILALKIPLTTMAIDMHPPGKTPEDLFQGVRGAARETDRLLQPHRKAPPPKEASRIDVSPDAGVTLEQWSALLDRRVMLVEHTRDMLTITFQTGEKLTVSYGGDGLMVRVKSKADAEKTKALRAVQELIESGHAGITGDGRVVDIRKVPQAAPLPKRT